MKNIIVLEKMQRLFSFKGYGVSEAEIKKRVIDSTYISHIGSMVLLVILESYMLLTSIMRFGTNISGLHLYRRYLYAALGSFSFIMVLILIYLYKKRLYSVYQRVSIFPHIIIIGWGCGMTVIDCFKGNDISVFTYTILVMAALSTHIEFFYCAGVFVFYTVLINYLFYIIPEITYTLGMHVNSIYTCILAFILSLFVSYQNKNSKALEIKNELLLEELASSNKKLEQQSNRDGLTGLYNRMFLDKLKEEHILSGRFPTGIIMLDADKFKLFNDTYGHINGDLCLRYIAEKLQNIPDSENGYSIRYGGEEFLVVYYEIDRGRLKANAERIFESIREGSFLIDGDVEKKITVSMGVFACTGSTLTIHDMIKYADEALYLAKERGRNQIVWSLNKKMPASTDTGLLF